MVEWLAPEVLDLHGYATPTLIEATTKAHNPSVEYDLWLKWNQGRIDANEAALKWSDSRFSSSPDQRLVLERQPAAPELDLPRRGFTRPGRRPRARRTGLSGGPFSPCTRNRSASTPPCVEMCQSVSQCGGRAGARLASTSRAGRPCCTTQPTGTTWSSTSSRSTAEASRTRLGPHAAHHLSMSTTTG